jgi:excisionase family DNA binding protein
MLMANYTFIKKIMEQRIVTNEDLYGVITTLVQKVESLESSIQDIKNTSDKDKLLDIEELAEFLGKSKVTVYRLKHDKKIPYIKQGNRIYFLKKDVMEWLKSNRRESKATTLRDVEKMMAAKSTSFSRSSKRI